jgi:hypothetical protein
VLSHGNYGIYACGILCKTNPIKFVPSILTRFEKCPIWA